MSIRIDAAADSVSRSASLPSGDPVTVQFKVYLVNDRNALGYLWFLCNSVASAFDSVRLGADGTTLQIATPAGNTVVGSLSTATWYTITYRRNGSSHRCRIDNGADVTRTESNTFTSAFMFMGSDGAAWLDGRLADVKVWTAELSDTEIETERLNSAPQRTTSLHGYWPMKAGSPERLTDYSGNSRTWTANGTLTDEADPGDIGTDSGTLTESAVLDAPDSKIGSDSGTLTDVSELGTTGMTDTAVLGEASGIGLAASDSATLSDTTTTFTVSLTAVDTGTLTDVSSLDAGGTAKTANDSATLSDTSTLVISLVGVDTGALTEAVSLTSSVSASDGGTFSEAVSAADRTAVDSAVLSESGVIGGDVLPHLDAPIRVTLGQGRRVTLG